jgi:hypothetical protein
MTGWSGTQKSDWKLPLPDAGNVRRVKPRGRCLPDRVQATRNNEMELRAVSMGLRALHEPCDVSVSAAGHPLEPPQGWPPSGSVPRPFFRKAP